MLTESFPVALAEHLLRAARTDLAWHVAVGGGDPRWDMAPPLPRRGARRLVNELARRPVGAGDVCFVDDTGAPTDTPTPRLRLSVRFGSDEGNGTLREVGLFAGAGPGRDSGTMLSYFAHPPIEKTAAMSLERAMYLDLSPRPSAGATPTRYLGNSRSREVHDLESAGAACQVDEILLDRRVYFGSLERAAELGYDLCAFCFGRERSTR